MYNSFDTLSDHIFIWFYIYIFIQKQLIARIINQNVCFSIFMIICFILFSPEYFARWFPLFSTIFLSSISIKVLWFFEFFCLLYSVMPVKCCYAVIILFYDAGVWKMWLSDQIYQIYQVKPTIIVESNNSNVSTFLQASSCSFRFQFIRHCWERFFLNKNFI